ncbi:flagellar basal body P-ring formation chaperone FlgA [Marinobacter sp. NP-4(2019)]|uniref:flagellar basal body P-ring formation chaperone FlgA n=1 Tax=Marinobacter sp. NP-4(2019) TaxID=2488665 RepID=UPI0019820DE5|nr:flagellar basal body P-ring formation chaperone FlgA [Marinobacter sp. NP-4(2019)]
MRTTIFVVTLLLSAAGLARAESTTAEQIKHAADSFLETFAEQQAKKGFDVTHKTGRLDSRLALATCEQPLAVSFSGDPWQSTHPTLQVACQGERPWRMFLNASVSIRGEGLVAARPLARGERIMASMIAAEPVVLNATRKGVITDIDQLVGMEMRRGVNAGTMMTPDLLSAPAAVTRGDHVIITARKGSFTVNSRGKAMADAGVGDQVVVENLSSSRTVKALVTAPGQVEIPM